MHVFHISHPLFSCVVENLEYDDTYETVGNVRPKKPGEPEQKYGLDGYLLPKGNVRLPSRDPSQKYTEGYMNPTKALRT